MPFFFYIFSRKRNRLCGWLPGRCYLLKHFYISLICISAWPIKTRCSVTEAERWLSSSDLISHATEIMFLCPARYVTHRTQISCLLHFCLSNKASWHIYVWIYPSRHCLRSSSPQIKYYLLTLLQVEFHFSKGILLIEISFFPFQHFSFQINWPWKNNISNFSS